MSLKPGSRWKSVTCDTEVVVVRPPKNATDQVPECGGYPMVPQGEAFTAEKPKGKEEQGTLLGKRYTSEQEGLELLCTKGGDCLVHFAGKPLTLVESKKLPSSD